MAVKQPFDIQTRFFDRIEKSETGCWLWTGSKSGKGYGRAYLEHAEVNVHRWSYEHFVGPIPDGLEIDHLCRTPPCCNPEHLEPVTTAENARRRRLTHCFKGHPRTDEYVVTYAGKRYCRVCEKAKRAAYRKRPGNRERLNLEIRMYRSKDHSKSPERPFQCELCELWFKTPQALGGHRKCFDHEAYAVALMRDPNGSAEGGEG